MPLPPVHAADRFRDLAVSASREIAVCLTAVLLVGLGAIQSAAAPVAAGEGAPALSSALQVAPAPLTDGPLASRADRLPLMVAPAAPVTAVVVPAAAPPPAPAVPRWLPTGTGMWLHEWRKSENGDPRAVVTRAQKVGLSHLFVQTGSSAKGWIGEEVLSALMPVTQGTGLKVIAWDFPKLDDPEGDARRMAQAASWSRPGAPRVAAVAPDVETPAEGTRLSPDRVIRYYAALRAALPPEIPILATVPWPSEKRIGKYPYAESAPYTDAFAPMVYWYNRPAGDVTSASMNWLKQFGKPIVPVGQGYDGRLDAPYLAADPAPERSVQAFVDGARAGGAQAISLWSWQTTGALQWDVLARAGAGFAAPPPAPAPVPEPAPSLVEQLFSVLRVGPRQ